MSIDALEGVTDQDLYDAANADEVTEPVAEAPEPVQEEQPRDEAGRFAAQAEPEPAPAVTDPPAPPVDDNAAMVPSWRVREINEEKRALAEKVAAFEAEKLQWQQRPAPQPAPEVKAEEEPDPLLDPKGYKEFVLNQTREIILNDRREASLLQAHRTYKAEFEEAYAAAQKQVDPVLKVKMQNSRDPGETLMEWHREQKTRAEVGTDHNAYFQKRLDAWLADPANQAKVIEKARGTAQQTGTRQAAPVNLPPSLTRTASVAAISADDDDISDEGLWRNAHA